MIIGESMFNYNFVILTGAVLTELKLRLNTVRYSPLGPSAGHRKSDYIKDCLTKRR